MLVDHATNRTSWDMLAEAHGQDAYYDAASLLAGGSSLIKEEEEVLLRAVGTKLAGLRVLHLQCHLGFDAISLARRGAHVTAVDFSEVALAKGSLFAQQCNVDVEWICADAINLPKELTGRFDLVWATIGVLCWIADLDLWMANVRMVLAGGGRLVLIDGYPGGRVGSSEGPPKRRYVESGWDYATPLRTGPQVQFGHDLSSITQAAHWADLTVLSLAKHEEISNDLRIPGVLQEEDGLYRRRVERRAQPILFSMIATLARNAAMPADHTAVGPSYRA